MIAIQYRNHSYACARDGDGIRVIAKPGREVRTALVADETAALRFLCDHSLKRPKALVLIEAALHGTGEYAASEHPNRVALETAAEAVL